DVYDASRFQNNAFLQVGEDGKITDVVINQGIQLHSNMLLGVYVIERELLDFLVSQCMAHNKVDFERNIIQEMCGDLDIYGWCCDGYVEKVDSIDTFRKANMALLEADIRDELFSNGKILTKVRDEVPTYYSDSAEVKNSILADGCIINGTVENSIIFRSVTVGEGAHIKNSIVMQSSKIGENAVIENCILDKNVFVSEGQHLVGAECYPLVLAKDSRI
ncbi:MAG: glucose-1-phosphate adenylyltransferase subunit GlgD, partial [Clostridia bacterium]